MFQRNYLVHLRDGSDDVPCFEALNMLRRDFNHFCKIAHSFAVESKTAADDAQTGMNILFRPPKQQPRPVLINALKDALESSSEDSKSNPSTVAPSALVEHVLGRLGFGHE
mmetsp:Transcript_4531/g.9372  ORF Transcript_4531/g.9372 Transcript_4531/m.9372 type:complete len:111 (+) Transcript_4531:560-892(+)